MAKDFYQAHVQGGGYLAGRTLVQASGEIGGYRHVFVKLQGGAKNGLVFPTVGNRIMNPFKGRAKAYAGDLFEYHTNGEGYLLKTYLVVSVDGTTINIARDGYKHKPFVGDILMVAPNEIGGEGTAVTVTAVEKTTVDGTDVWALTVSEALEANADDVLVEGKEAGTTTPVVTNPNTFLPCDYDFLYSPAEDDDDFEGAKYLITPCIANADTKIYVDKMSPLPASIKALNKSLIDGWFNL